LTPQLSIHQILIKYWGFSTFRPLQEDIINSVMMGNDALALLPTGGGKSVCFQVPAMAMKGMCLVISPLIALMKDQVQNLNKKGIKAIGVYSGMTRNEIDIALDNCVYGDTKFLYVSPERLANELFRVRLKKMKLCLIAVDEAHCISQWGYDFRPPYLKIADIREFSPQVPLLALTATATENVIKDIQQKLLFKKENLFRISFERKNVTYAVIEEEDKMNRLLRILSKVSGSGIIYVRNRRKTKEIAQFLMNNKIAATFYHAGLEQKDRDEKQDAWLKGKSRIIVATNAFGMGIDKPNVRLVVHMDLPDSLEAYFQEAGRAGRDEKQAYSVLLYNNSDVIELKHNIDISYPALDDIKKVYQALGNYFQLATGSGADASFDFDIAKFSASYKFSSVLIYNSIRFLEKDGYILASDNLNEPSRLNIPMNREDLYRFQVQNPFYDKYIKTILRSYSGVLTDFVRISETDLSKRMEIPKEKIVEGLTKMHKLKVVNYIPQKQLPQIIYCKERMDIKEVVISANHYNERKNESLKRIDAVINYVTSQNKCRSRILLNYFGETDAKRCGKCDVCLERNKAELSEMEFDEIINQIKPLLLEKQLSMDELVKNVKGVGEDRLIRAIQWLIDNDKITTDNSGNMKWKK
jgi:ATP-dependent DNA helicase RecQ